MFTAVVVLVVGVAALLCGLYLLHRIVSIGGDPEMTLPFQSGWLPREHALSRYHVRWYLATLVFLAFAVEMLFMYPVAVVVAAMGGCPVVGDRESARLNAVA